MLEIMNQITLPLPPYYIIEPTNICNYRCSICPVSLRNTYTPTGYMDMSLFYSIVKQIRTTAKGIQLFWVGEPLLNGNIFEMIKVCKMLSSAEVSLSTNGSLLSKKISDKLDESGLDKLIVSVDACDSQYKYSQIRVGGDIDQLNMNIYDLLSKDRQMKVELQFIDMYINKDEKQPFLEKWRQYECTQTISCLYTWANQMPDLNNKSDNLSPVKFKKRVPCVDLWLKMAIHYNGDVSACCFDYANKINYGNCNKSSLYSIWNSAAARNIRKLHLDNNYSFSICKECDAWAELSEYYS